MRVLEHPTVVPHPTGVYPTTSNITPKKTSERKKKTVAGTQNTSLLLNKSKIGRENCTVVSVRFISVHSSFHSPSSPLIIFLRISLSV